MSFSRTPGSWLAAPADLRGMPCHAVLLAPAAGAERRLPMRAALACAADGQRGVLLSDEVIAILKRCEIYFTLRGRAAERGPCTSVDARLLQPCMHAPLHERAPLINRITSGL